MRTALLLATIACAPTLAEESGSTWLADLPPDVRRALAAEAASADPATALSRVLHAAPAYRFESELFTVFTDRRWYRTLPEGPGGGPEMVLRRWPGDSFAAFYVLAGPAVEARPGVRIPGGEDPEAVPAASDDERVWEGRLETELGARPYRWIERRTAGARGHLGILLVPGDAGLGEGAVASLLAELIAVAGRVELAPQAWERAGGLAAGEPIAVPEGAWLPGEGDERRDPWQIASGAGFTLGLPPGLRARRTDLGLPAMREIEGDRIWLRGRFVDRDGERVVVGDGRRAGYLAMVEPATAAWKSGGEPPRGAIDAQAVAGESYEVAAEWAGADWARAERWREEGFTGEWLVFRLGLGSVGVEIGLPVLAGRRSLALFWIPAMWRGPGEPPAPPPIDPARRFGIRFEKLVGRDRRTHPLTEGFLWAPGFRMELPKGWWPVASLRSRNGFPVTLVDEGGARVGALSFLEGGTVGLERDGWEAIPRPRSHGAEQVRRRGDGAWVFVSPDGWAYLLEPGETDPRGAGWERMARSVGLSRIRKRGSVQ